MSIWINSSVKILTDPRKIQTKTGNPMTVAFVGASTEGEDLFTFNIVAFGDMAAELARYTARDSIAITGTLKSNDYTTKTGEERKGFQVILDGLAGVKRRQPVQEEKKPKSRQGNGDRQRAGMAFQGSDDFEDELSF